MIECELEKTALFLWKFYTRHPQLFWPFLISSRSHEMAWRGSEGLYFQLTEVVRGNISQVSDPFRFILELTYPSKSNSYSSPYKISQILYLVDTVYRSISKAVLESHRFI